MPVDKFYLFKNGLRLRINFIHFKNDVDASGKSFVHINKYMGAEGFTIARSL